MFSKDNIIEVLNKEDLFIDNFILEAFIKNWKIESIYEDANGVEFFDDMAVEKIRQGIKQKTQPKYEINIMDKDDIKPVDMAVEIPENTLVEEIVEEPSEEPAEEVKQIEEEIPKIPETELKDFPVTVLQEVAYEVNREVENELKNVTLDISNQTLAVLAESIARKITYDVADFLKKTDFMEDAVKLGECKKDNEILVEKIDELICDNKILIQRIEELEKESDSFAKLFGNVYIKNK